MAQIYQHKTTGPYILPDNLYRRMWYLVKDYDRLRAEWREAVHATPTPDGMPKGNQTGDPVPTIAARRETIFQQIEAVEQALTTIPPEYQREVMRHIQYGTPFPDYAGRNTWFRHQSRFLYSVAEKMHEI